MRRGLEPIAVRPIPPYRITPHLERYCLSGEPMPCTYEHESKRWRALLRVGDSERPLAVVVRSEGHAPELLFLVEDDLERGLREKAVSALRWVFSLDVDYVEFIRRASSTPLQQLAWKGFGLRPARAPGVYEALLMALVWDQEKPARALAELVRRTASSTSIRGETFYGSPSPDAILSLGVEGLKSIGFSQQKAEALLGVASAQRSGSLPSLEAASENPRELARSLEEIPGIGRSTAEIAASLVSRRPWGAVSVEAAARRISERLGLRYDPDEMERALGDYVGLAYYLAEHLSQG